MASCAMKQEGPRLVCLSVDQNHVIYGFDVEQGFSFVEITKSWLVVKETAMPRSRIAERRKRRWSSSLERPNSKAMAEIA
jgi:hypothetical protein